MEKITNITEGEFVLTKGEHEKRYEGFVIETNKQQIKIGIGRFQQCCEEFGYLMSEDNPSDYIGAELLSIYKTDKDLNSIPIELMKDMENTKANAIFINFETSKGVFQITAYNVHNGYYGHSAVVISNQLSIDTTL